VNITEIVHHTVRASALAPTLLNISANEREEVEMGLVWALIVGLVIGALAKLLMPGRDGGGIIVTSLLGVAGSLLAFAIGRSFGLYGRYEDGPGILASLLGSILVLALYRVFTRRRRRWI
jgi:uncharacterized membrane protein YeaQ/YmgE (transglycosylase-associated protein family)